MVARRLVISVCQLIALPISILPARKIERLEIVGGVGGLQEEKAEWGIGFVEATFE